MSKFNLDTIDIKNTIIAEVINENKLLNLRGAGKYK